MHVIGAGFGRTGTLSMKLALEQLGFGPCCHMTEVVRTPDLLQSWRAVAEGASPDWTLLLDGYSSAVDWPTSSHWFELVDAFPMAWVILTVRDSESWYTSMERTLYRQYRELRAVQAESHMAQSSTAADFLAMTEGLIWNGIFGGRFEDRAAAIAQYEWHNDQVRKIVPADRLLIHEVGSGWEPLCEFLGVPVPAQDFPRANDSEAFASTSTLNAVLGGLVR